MDSVQQTTNGLPGLADRRKALGLTQERLAEMAELHRVTLSDYERGRQDPRQATVRKLAEILNCQPGDLVNTPAPSEVSPNARSIGLTALGPEQEVGMSEDSS